VEFRVLVRGDATPADGAHHGPRAVPVLHRQPAEHDDREDDGVDVELPVWGARSPTQEGSPMVLIRKTNVYANANGRAITSPVATAIRIRSHCC